MHGLNTFEGEGKPSSSFLFIGGRKMKKKILIIMSFLLFINLIVPKESYALTGKVANVAAKKVAKEIAQDVAIDMTFNMIMDYKYVPKDDRLKAKEGFEMICLPANRKSGGDCDKPMQIKKNITRAELAPSIDSQLDKKIAGGVTSTKWGKFLDFFLPIFSVGMGVAVVDYAINGEVSDLFDEIAFSSLSELGMLETIANADVEDLPKQIDTYFSVMNLHKEGSFTGHQWDGIGNAILQFQANGSTHTTTSFERIYWTQRVLDDPSRYNDAYRERHGKYRDLNRGVLFESMAGANILVNGQVIPLTISDNKVPKFNETGLGRTYTQNQRIAIPAPGSLPFTRTSTGETLYPEIQKDGSIIYKTKTGTIVDESDITVGEPQRITNPDGSTTIQKQPTYDNQNPKPDENGKIPPKDNDPNKENEFPEGQSCDATLKLPSFSRLFTTMSESFPFSIPWDLKNGFDALFSDMGTEEPNFKLNLKFMNQTHVIDIKIDSYFDKWKPFVHSMLLFIFDVGILYGIFRLIKGGG